MKFKYVPIYIMFLISLIFSDLSLERGSISVMATGFSTETSVNMAFSTEDVTEERQKTFLSNLHITFLQEEPKNKSIVCFDVNEEGLIALGFSTSNNKMICIYTIEGIFQYGYSFNAAGNFGVEWNGDEITIYFVRSDIAATITPKGEIIKILKIQNTSENDYYWRHSVFAKERIVGDSTYIIRNDMGPLNIITSSFSQLVVIDKEEHISVIYDVNSTQLLKYIVIIITLFLLISIAVSVILIRLFKIKR